jgi:hypothetical protein
MTGCSLDAMPELTDEESALISEYAAGLLLKYSPNYDYKIVDNVALSSSVDYVEEEQEVPESTQTESTTEEETLDSPTDVEASEQLLEDENTQKVSSDTDIAPILGISDVSIKYDSYEICDSYPKDTNGFNVSASSGNMLLVIHFNIENNSDEDCNLNLIEDNITARITVNDSLSGNGLNTMLPNDLTSYYDTISANATTDAVVLAQLSEGSAQDLTAISVKISATNGSVDIEVK